MATRLIVAFAALGAGLIHLATAIGSPPAIAAVVAIIGIAEFGWGVIAAAAHAIPIANAARVGALLPVVLWILVLVVAGSAELGPFTSSLRLAPMLVASLLDFVVVIGITVDRRRPRATRRIVLTVIGGLVITGLTLAGLVSTEAGDQARAGTGFFGHEH